MAAAVVEFPSQFEFDMTRNLLGDVVQGGIRKQRAYALQFASRDGLKDAVLDTLRNGVNANAKTNAGMTAIMFASMGNHVDIIKMLIEWGADPTVQSFDGCTALKLAQIHQNREAVEFFQDYMLRAPCAIVCTLRNFCLKLRRAERELHRAEQWRDIWLYFCHCRGRCVCSVWSERGCTLWWQRCAVDCLDQREQCRRALWGGSWGRCFRCCLCGCAGRQPAACSELQRCEGFVRELAGSCCVWSLIG